MKLLIAHSSLFIPSAPHTGAKRRGSSRWRFALTRTGLSLIIPGRWRLRGTSPPRSFPWDRRHDYHTFESNGTELTSIIERIAARRPSACRSSTSSSARPRAGSSASTRSRRRSSCPSSSRSTTRSAGAGGRPPSPGGADPEESSSSRIAALTAPATSSRTGKREVRVFYQPHNQGKGAALREGFRHATATSSSSRTPTWSTTPRNTRS